MNLIVSNYLYKRNDVAQDDVSRIKRSSRYFYHSHTLISLKQVYASIFTQERSGMEYSPSVSYSVRTIRAKSQSGGVFPAVYVGSECPRAQISRSFIVPMATGNLNLA